MLVTLRIEWKMPGATTGPDSREVKGVYETTTLLFRIHFMRTRFFPRLNFSANQRGISLVETWRYDGGAGGFARDHEILYRQRILPAQRQRHGRYRADGGDYQRTAQHAV
jgi:hypothetical protein